MSAAVRGLLSPFSVEITPRETTKLPPLSGLLDPGTAVYLTFLPNVAGVSPAAVNFSA